MASTASSSASAPAPASDLKEVISKVTKNQFSKIFRNNSVHGASETKKVIDNWIASSDWSSTFSALSDEDKHAFFIELKKEFEKIAASKFVSLDFSEILPKGKGIEPSASSSTSMEVTLFESAALISPLVDSLSEMSISEDLIEMIRKNAISFATFGKKNSHSLRSKLMRMLKDENVSSEGRFLIYFLFSQVKNKTRVLEAIRELPTELKSHKAFVEVNSFITKRLVQYVSDETPSTFAAVHLPTTNPGLDILCFVLMTNKESREPAMLYEKQTFAQLFLDMEMQREARDGNKRFWEKTVISTRNSRNVGFKAEFHEDFYNNSAADKYPLVNYDKTLMACGDSGYTYGDLEIYLSSVPSLVD